MEVHLTPDLQAQLDKLVLETGRQKDELVQDAIAGYCSELICVRDMLSKRYNEIKSGCVKPLDGIAFFDGLRRREADALKQRPR